MNFSLPNSVDSVRRNHASARIVLLVVICFLLGIGVSAVWFSRRSGLTESPSTANTTAAASALSPSTRAVLDRLSAPIEMHFYSVLDPATVPDSLRAFAGRVDRLVTEYEQAGKGRIKLVKYDGEAKNVANSAVADGLKPFNQDKGDACFLGIAVIHDGKKETLAQLAPDWEAALESDLSRAIVNLSQTSPTLQAAAAPPPIDPAAEEEVKRALPNLASISLEEGTQALRQFAQQDLARAAQETDARIKEAQQRYLDAEKSQSAAELDAARKQLMQLQAEQTQRLKQIIAKSQAQIEVLQRLKSGTP